MYFEAIGFVDKSHGLFTVCVIAQTLNKVSQHVMSSQQISPHLGNQGCEDAKSAERSAGAQTLARAVGVFFGAPVTRQFRIYVTERAVVASGSCNEMLTIFRKSVTNCIEPGRLNWKIVWLVAN